jgi:hypothetical protein
MARVIPNTWQVPEQIVSRFGTQAGRQRAMVHDGHLVLVTHLPPTPDKTDREAALFWRAPDGTWKSTANARGGLAGLRGLLDSYKQRVADIDERAGRATRAGDYFDALHAIGPVVRAARNLHKTLQDARDAVPKDKDIIALRDLAYENERTAENVQNDAKIGLDYETARQAEEQSEHAQHIARSSHKLNLIAAMFLPISALGALFGMNLAHGLETAPAPHVFWALVVAAFLLGFALRAGIARKEKG